MRVSSSVCTNQFSAPSPYWLRSASPSSAIRHQSSSTTAALWVGGPPPLLKLLKHGGTKGTETHGGPGLSRRALGAGRASGPSPQPRDTCPSRLGPRHGPPCVSVPSVPPCFNLLR